MATSQSQSQRKRQNRNRRPGGGGNRGGKSRNNNNKGRSSNQGGGSRSGGYIRSKVPRRTEPTLGEKLLSFFTFGLLGKPEERQRKRPPKPEQKQASNNRQGSSTRNKPKSKPRSGGRDNSQRQKRGPELVEVSSERLYVGNLSYDAGESDLIELFKGVGSVSSAEVVSHRRTQRSKGYAFVIMGSVEEAKRAVEVLHDKDFMGRKLVVSGAKSPGVREGEKASAAPRNEDEEIRPPDDAEDERDIAI